MKPHVEQLFHEVVDLPEPERSRHVAASGAGPDTRGELARLLSYSDETSPLLEDDIRRMAAHTLARLESAEAPGAMRCGPYLTRELLGRGGMGAVYLAERVDGEVTQKAAIKLLRTGGDDPQLRMRFLAERQILAGLSHPNVARLLDAGHREDGQPYLVMEYVEGQPLDQWAEKVSQREILRVFLKVCAAVAYLHRNLVVHRDLKPANILVNHAGEPKLLDFGIAKILDMTADSGVTGTRMLTPDYASPEQVTGNAVSTATDVYSLGAVLYRLLTGQPPHRFENETPGEIIRQVSSGMIPAPSKLAPQVRGDLEFVLLKALRTEPYERYSTVEQFSEDLANYLAKRPIRARQGETWYQFRKFLRRYWVYAAVGGLVIGSLATGLYIANRERVIAERRFAQLRQLSRRVTDVDAPMRALPGSVEIRQKLVAASLEYLEGLRPEAARDPDVAQDVADGYWRMARIQGVNTDFNLGDSAKADDSLRKAQALMDSVMKARPGEGNAMLRAAVIAHDRMLLADTEERRADALGYAKTAVANLEAVLRLPAGAPLHFEGLFRPGDGRDPVRTRIAAMFGNVALAHVNLHLYEDGARYARRAVEVAASLDPKPALGPKVQGLGVLANAQRYQGDLDGALATIHQAKRLVEEGSYDNDAARFFSRYGILLREALVLGETGAPNLNRPEEAVSVLEEALALTEGAAKKDPRDSASRSRVGTVTRLMGTLLSARDPKRALAMFDLGIQRLSEAKGLVNRREKAGLLARSAAPLRALGRGAEARTRLGEAFAILRETGDYPKDDVRIGNAAWVALSAQADEEAAAGRFRESAHVWEKLLAAAKVASPEAENDLRDVPKLSQAYQVLAGLYRKAGDGVAAQAAENRRVQLWAQWRRRLPESGYVREQAERALARL